MCTVAAVRYDMSAKSLVCVPSPTCQLRVDALNGTFSILFHHTHTHTHTKTCTAARPAASASNCANASASNSAHDVFAAKQHAKISMYAMVAGRASHCYPGASGSINPCARRVHIRNSTIIMKSKFLNRTPWPAHVIRSRPRHARCQDVC